MTETVVDREERSRGGVWGGSTGNAREIGARWWGGQIWKGAKPLESLLTVLAWVRAGDANPDLWPGRRGVTFAGAALGIASVR